MLSSPYEWLSYIEDTPFWNVLFYFELLVLDFFIIEVLLLMQLH